MAVQFTQEQYAFLVEQFACGETADSAAFLFAREFSPAKIEPKDLGGFVRKKLPADWQAYFDICREAFKTGAATSDQAFLLALLDKHLIDASARRSHAEVLRYAEMIAKIKGGFFGGKAAPGGAGGAGDTPPVKSITVKRTIVDPVVEPAA